MSIAALAPALADAARIVSRVAAGRSLAEELDGAERSTPRAALLDLTHGTLRRFGRGPAIVRELSHRGKADELVEPLLWCALYALESGRYASYTVVDQAVRACGLLEKWNAKGYVNAVLRGALRERSSLETRIAADPEARYQHPKWWIDLLRHAYPESWQETLAAGNTHPPMGLRVNRRRTSVDAYLARLADAGIAARKLGDAGVLLERPVAVAELPGFETGDASVQDAGAQRAVPCLDLQPGQRVLDACAAPESRLHAACRVVARRAVRSHPRRRAVLGFGHRAPASGSEVAAPRAGPRVLRRAAERNPRCALAGAARGW
jgi:16S rRNA (cytosine967-C5)-methyltransferase